MTKRTGQLPLVEGGSLPTWVVKRTKLVPDWLRLHCPRCGGQAIVDPTWPVGGYATRPCTYCFAASKIPPRLREPSRKPTTSRRTK